MSNETHGDAAGGGLAAVFRDARPVVSVEFFPPKTDEGARQIFDTAGALREHRIAFASITYGAGGSTRERTLEYGALLRERHGFRVVPHLTCVGHPRAELASLLDRILDGGFDGVFALRGDPPTGTGGAFVPPPDGFAHAAELVALARERRAAAGAPDFAIGCAGYPEKHPEAPDAATDLRHLAAKVAAGADFVTTQLFFDNAAFHAFERGCRAAGVSVPIIPGILPATSLAQAKKFCQFGARLPAALEARFEQCGGDAQAERRAGLEWTLAQIRELLAGGAPGFHLYILNRADPALELLARLRDTEE
ncbi:MAG: methylenetetrahydrofolate reductase [Puniceicoccales bacterium]|jgi:methylenetetrahydrofolate reductase (NADPH)|nr:methylenetetrahydrofolate reductase [Puniceicoccales bacterium]